MYASRNPDKSEQYPTLRHQDNKLKWLLDKTCIKNNNISLLPKPRLFEICPYNNGNFMFGQENFCNFKCKSNETC